MLPVRSGVIGRKIDESRVVEVAKGAIEEVLQGTPDHSQQMNPFDRFYDRFCNGVKREAISRISGMSRHTARLHTELEKPISMQSGDVLTIENSQIEENQNKLSVLMQGGTLEFGQIGSRAIVDHRSYLIYTDKSKTSPIGVALYKSSEGVSAGCGERVIGSIPNFESSEAIHEQDLNSIRASRKIMCSGKEYQVRVHGLDEPIVLYSSRETYGKAVQSKLSELWVDEQTGRSLDELERLEQLDGCLLLPSILPELVTGQSRSTAEIDILNEWAPVSRDAVCNLKALADLFHEKLQTEKDALKVKLVALNNHRGCHEDLRKVWLQTRLEIPAFVNKQETMRHYIHDVRQIYCKLYFLARNSETSELRSLFKIRIERFNACLKSYLAGDVEEEVRVTFNRIKNALEEFVRNFDTTQLLRCTNLFDPPPVIVKPRKVIQPPKSPGAQVALKELLMRPKSSWEQVAQAMKTLESRQNELLATCVLRHELTVKVNGAFKSFKGEHGEGLDPETGKSFYTPETFSRIISLKEIRNELMDSRMLFTSEALRGKDGVVAGHIMSIQNETLEIDQNEKRPWPFKRTSMYWPDKNEKNGKHVDHSEWIYRHGYEKFAFSAQQKLSTGS